MSKWIKALRCDDGQALVELAFVLPLVLLFLFGIIDFGLALNNQNADTNMANLAARTASVIGSSASVPCNGQSPAPTTLQLWVACEAASDGAPTPTVCVADTAGATPSSTYTAGDPIKVTVTSHFNWLSLISSKVANLGSTISASATMRMEVPPTTGNTFLSGTPLCS